jgi:hypothetical protein
VEQVGRNFCCIFREREKFFSTRFLLKDLKMHEKCIFMVCGRGRCQNGRGFRLKWQ